MNPVCLYLKDKELPSVVHPGYLPPTSENGLISSIDTVVRQTRASIGLSYCKMSSPHTVIATVWSQKKALLVRTVLIACLVFLYWCWGWEGSIEPAKHKNIEVETSIYKNSDNADDSG